MLIFPAIDIIGGEAVRLYQGNYKEKTVYNINPLAVASDFEAQGAECIHIVDLDGAKSGNTPNFELICRIKKQTGLFCEVGGGIRNMELVSAYLSAGIDRVILGTAAVKDPAFLEAAVKRWGEGIAVGIDIKDGFISVSGWTENSGLEAFDFCRKMQNLGVKTVICTDISKDGAMKGTNAELYRDLSREFSFQLTASGGVSSLKDVKTLRALDLYAAIIGKAYYTGAISLKDALEAAK